MNFYYQAKIFHLYISQIYVYDKNRYEKFKIIPGHGREKTHEKGEEKARQNALTDGVCLYKYSK